MHTDEVFLPYTKSGTDMSFTCFACGAPNFSTSLFENVYDDASHQAANSNHSILSTDISSDFSADSSHCNITGISAISSTSTCNSSRSSSSCHLNRPSCSSPTPKIKHNIRTNNIRIASINIQSVMSRKKKASFWNFLDSTNCDFICGCETWLKPSIYDAEVLPPNSNYNIFRKDRPDGYGGSMIHVRNNIVCEPVDIDTLCDAIFLKLDSINKESIIVGSVYRPTNNDINYASNLYDAISKVVTKFKKSTIWIAGDFNLPDIQWSENSIIGHTYRKAINDTFLQLEPDLGLSQIVDFPTRGDNTLDLFLTNRPHLVNRCTAIPGISDHHALFIDTNSCAQRRKTPKQTIYMWGKANIANIKMKSMSLSNTIISMLQEHHDINLLWKTFKDGCHHIISDEVPSRPNSNRFTQPWITKNVRRLTRLKRRRFRKAKRTNSPSDWANYHEIKRRTQRACRSAHNSHVDGMLAVDNPKVFWHYIKTRRKDCFGVSQLKQDGITYCDAQKKAEILNSQFSSVFTNEDLTNQPTLPPSSTPPINPIKVTLKGVQKLLNDLKPHKAAGPDLIPARLLKMASVELAPGLTNLFQTSLDLGCIPDDWKSALVSPVFKKGNRSSPSNYRPISLTSIVCKLLEHIISSSIMSHFDSLNILSDCQHGFRKKRSCDTQLILTINDLARSLNSNQQIDAITLDFSKAFDKVPHSRLLQKLDFYGIRGKTLDWIEDFLSSRTQKVVLDGASSSSAPVTSGVPQGSVLGPTLFLVYINDLPLKVRSKARLFADDCLLYRTVSNKADSEELQRDLDRLQGWEYDWQMSFNPDKCEVIHISTKRHPILNHYSIHGTRLQTTNSTKYLGVTISSDLSWNQHVNNITKKANSTLSFIRRNIGMCPEKAKSSAYMTYVRPTLEYASSVWSPHTDCLIQQLNMVQRRAARFVKHDYGRTSSVSDMLSNLGWDSLQKRRDTARLNMFYKILHGLVDITPDPPLRSARSTRGNPLKFMQITSAKALYQHSFFPASIILWNKLPNATVSQSTLAGFTASLTHLNTP